MTAQRFWVVLAATTVGTFVVNYVFQLFVPSLKQHNVVAWWSLLLFAFLSIPMYIIGKKAALSSQKLLFIQVIMVFILVKMLLAIAILLIYKKLYKPESSLFVLPFFVAYFIFIIFETYFMTRLARLKRGVSSEQ
jgi:hypothetical protein